MLVVRRHVGETIVIGEGESQITITVTSFKGGGVKLGVDAPPEVAVHRGEVYEQIQKEKSNV